MKRVSSAYPLLLILTLTLSAACLGASDATSAAATSQASTSGTSGPASATADPTSSSSSSTASTASTDGDTTSSSSSSSTAASTSSDTSTGDTSTGDTSTGGELVGCAPAWPATGPVQGSTPSGERVFTHVAFDPDGCDALEKIDLYFFEAMPDLGADAVGLPDVPTLRVSVYAFTWTDGWIATGPADVIFYGGDATYGEATGELTISALDVLDTSYMSDGDLPHWLSGQLVVDAPGWSLTGTFTAPICWAIAGFALCP